MQAQKLSNLQVRQVVNDKASLYESVIRNQLWTPKPNEAMMSIPFLKGLVGYNQYWLPRCEDISIRNCFDPPSR